MVALLGDGADMESCAKVSVIVSLAIIKANWDANQDYIDSLMGFVTECLLSIPSDIVTAQSISDELRSRFGLRLPLRVVERMLVRAREKGIVNVSDTGITTRNHEALSESQFSNVRNRVLSVHDSLIANLIGFARESYKLNWDNEAAEAALYSFIDDNQIELLGRALSPQHSQSEGVYEPATAKYVVARFVQEIEANRSDLFGHLEEIVKGHMLATALFLPDMAESPAVSAGASVYLDTTFLLNLLDMQGTALRLAAQELVELLSKSGARLKCFEHTIDEIQGILYAHLVLLRQGRIDEGYRPCLDYFVENECTPSDVELMSASLVPSLENLGIAVCPLPAYQVEYCIDEQSLESTISKWIRYRNQKALHRDVASISAVVRERRGKTAASLDNCGALFVTTNSSLVKVVQEFFSPGPDAATCIAPAVTDRWLTVVLWLKHPTAAPDLPRKRIIADCYAATNPSESMWWRYLQEAVKLRSQGDVSVDQYYHLRFSTEARRALMDVTMGQEDAISATTVREVLDSVRRLHRQDLEQELSDTSAKLAKVRSDLAHAHELEKQRRLRHEAWARSSARLAYWIAFIVLSMLVAAATLVTVRIFPIAIPLWKYLIAVGVALCTLLTILSRVRLLRVSCERFGEVVHRVVYRLLSWVSGYDERTFGRHQTAASDGLSDSELSE
jgi:hypothetical protein